MKYLLIGAFASGFFLYGIALIFGATGTTNLDRIANAVAAGAGRDPLLVIGLGLLLVGFGFKISSVPFHMWAPDVYEGAPTSITALIATGSKAAAFAALLRVLLTAVRGAPVDWPMLLWVVAALTMTVGNVVALAQLNLKRMLAYSSIAHVGYMLVGVVAGGAFGNGSVLFLIVCLSSLGLPGLNGFVGEFLILVGTFQVHRLAAVLASSGIIFAAVYLLWMYQRVCFGEVTSEANRRLTDLTPREWAVLLPVLLFIVWIGVYPTTFTTMTEPSVQALITQVQTKAQATSALLVPTHAEVRP
jgi:NADH:ubiquinone oxidoreductase subunit 2 (subunit N)